MASILHRGYSVPKLHFTPVFAVPALAHLKLGLNPVVAFRAAYILTRPPGASFSDGALSCRCTVDSASGRVL